MYYRRYHEYQIDDTCKRLVTTLKKLFNGQLDEEKTQKELVKAKTLMHDFSLYMNIITAIIKGIDLEELEKFKSAYQRAIKVVTAIEKNNEISEDAKELYSVTIDLFESYIDSFVRTISSGYENVGAKAYFGTYCLYKKNLLSYDELKNPLKVLSAVCQKKSSPNVLFSSNEKFDQDMITKIKTDKENYGDIRLYATENSSCMDKTRRENFEKVALGDPTSYVIQNHVFDVVFHRFRYDNGYHDGMKTSEMMFNKDWSRITRYIVNGGLLFMAMPAFLLDSDTCLMISKNYVLHAAYSISEHYEYAPYYAIFIFEKRLDISPSEKENTFQKLMNVNFSADLSPEDISNIIKNVPKYNLKEVKLITGEYKDRGYIAKLFDMSTIYKAERKEPEHKIKPILPLKKGQIGQILASGKLDGVIGEGNGFKHVIRGRVYKSTRTKNEQNYEDPMHATETTKYIKNNYVEIRLIAGDGTLKTIALTE